jgi:hypothetical protein
MSSVLRADRQEVIRQLVRLRDGLDRPLTLAEIDRAVDGATLRYRLKTIVESLVNAGTLNEVTMMFPSEAGLVPVTGYELMEPV